MYGFWGTRIASPKIDKSPNSSKNCIASNSAIVLSLTIVKLPGVGFLISKITDPYSKYSH